MIQIDEDNKTVISASEIINSLSLLNNNFFHIDDLAAYADKIIKLGKSVFFREAGTGKLLSYIFFYDNGPEVFITMVWTNPDCHGQGLAGKLLGKIIDNTDKDIALEVHADNPAKKLYKKHGFVVEDTKEENLLMKYSRRVAIMQPYLFPYIGYFHLIEATDKIVFYDDVNYIKSGWINRNRILLNGKEHLFTVALQDAGSFKLINEIRPLIDERFKSKFFKLIQSAYGKAPNYNDVSQIIFNVFKDDYTNVAQLAINSVNAVMEYLGKEISYTRSSECAPATKGMDKANRLIRITKDLGYNHYVNPPGGKELYDKEYFSEQGVRLSFIKSGNIAYQQFPGEFVPWLSIIDVLMFNDKTAVRDKFTQFSLE